MLEYKASTYSAYNFTYVLKFYDHLRIILNKITLFMQIHFNYYNINILHLLP